MTIVAAVIFPDTTAREEVRTVMGGDFVTVGGSLLFGEGMKIGSAIRASSSAIMFG